MDRTSRVSRTSTRAHLPVGHCDGTVIKSEQCRYSENQIIETSVKLTTVKYQSTTQLPSSYCILMLWEHVGLGTTRLLNSNLYCFHINRYIFDFHGSITVSPPVAYMAHMVAGKYLSVKIFNFHYYLFTS